MKEDDRIYVKNKWYKKGKHDMIIAVPHSLDLIAIGKPVGLNATEWMHIDITEWKRIKKFIDGRLKK